jgi:hypothetical protein
LPPGTLKAVILPAEGVNFTGCSALMRHSMAWPRISSFGGRMVVQPLAGGDAQLRLDQVDAGDGLGDGVLHLDAGVHLDEVELPSSSIRNSTVPAFW